jgi:hypothetical protein
MPRRPRPYMASKTPEQQRWRDVTGPIEPPRPAPVRKDPRRRYTDEEKIAIKAQIVERVAGGEFLEHICEAPDMPTSRTAYNWLHEDIQFGNEMNVAQRMLAGKLMADTIRIADDSSQDFDENGKPKWETIQRSTLRCKQREAIASKLDRNRWGDENVTTIKGDANSPLVVQQQVTMEKRLELFLEFQSRAGRGQPPRELSGFGRPVIEHQPKPKMSETEWTEYVQRIANGEQAAD